MGASWWHRSTISQRKINVATTPGLAMVHPLFVPAETLRRARERGNGLEIKPGFE